MRIKSIVRSALNFLRLDLTENLANDRLTRQIMRRVLRKDSNGIDVGCHHGEILQYLLKCAPEGHHFAFEPLPHLFRRLEKSFGTKVSLYPYALSDRSGTSTFQYVKNAPAYSGIRKRKYDVASPNIEEITVEVRTLDEIIPADVQIGFIKIDVEGAEFGVLKGAVELLRRSRPVVIFECGLGASDYYGTAPGALYDFLCDTCGLAMSALRGFMRDEEPLSRGAFEALFHANQEYNYICYPR